MKNPKRLSHSILAGLSSALVLFSTFAWADGASDGEPGRDQRPAGALDELAGQSTTVISFDGMRADFTRQYARQGSLPNLQRMMNNGVAADYSTTVFPSLTAPSHVSLGTGATPAQTGVVSNYFHRPGQKLTDGVSGFAAPIEVNPIWREARTQGKVTATVGWAGSNPDLGEQANYTVGYGKRWTGSAYETLSFRPAAGWTRAPESFSPAEEARISLPLGSQTRQINVLAVDTTDDQQVNYDRFYLSEDKEIGRDDPRVSTGEWAAFPLTIQPGAFGGFWFKLKETNDDLSRARMYRTSVNSNLIAGPNGFGQAIEQRFGFFPMQDDTDAWRKGWITRQEYEDISTRFVYWLTDVALYTRERYKPDLLMFYAPQIDHEEHEFLLTDPGQPGYTPEKSAEYLGYVEWAYRLADKVVGRTLETMDSDDNLFLVADHGMDPVRSMLEPNRQLKDAGLLVLDQTGKVDTSASKAYAFTSGSAAHVYVNLEGREQGGIVRRGDYENVVNQIVQTFDRVADRDGTKPYASVIRRNSADARKMGIDNPNSGDVILGAAPGYAMDGNPNAPAAIQPTWVLGMHGGDPAQLNLKAVFMGTGGSLVRGTTIGPVSNLDLAPTLYRILGINAPAFVQGRPLVEIFAAPERDTEETGTVGRK